MFETHYTSLDGVIVVAYLLGIVWFGFRVNRHIHNSSDYLVGGRATGTALSVATLIGTELGLVTLMYAAADGYRGGFAYFMVPLIWAVVTLVIGLTGFGISRLREMKLTTIPEFFEKRYNRKVRITAASVCLLAGVLNMSIFPKMGATFLTYVTGYGDQEDVELIVKVITTSLVLLVLLYTIIGGMVAVIVTDYIQFVVLSVGLMLGLLYCFSLPELNWQSVTESWRQTSGEAAFDPVQSSRYGWTYLAVQLIMATTATICWAPNATRSLTTDSPATTRRAYIFASAGMFARFAIPGLWGIVAFTFIHLPTGPEGLSAYFDENVGERAPQAMPLLLGKLIPSGLLGLLIGGLLAAFMSTHDSYLLSWASIGSQDIVGPILGRELSSRESITITRVFIVLIGIFLIVVGIWFPLPDDIWPFLFITGAIYLSGAATALIGGMYWRRASTTGAMLSLVGGLTAIAGLFDTEFQYSVAVWLDHVNDKGEVVTGIVAVYLNKNTITLACFAICAVLFVVGSLLFPDEKSSDETNVDHPDK